LASAQETNQCLKGGVLNFIIPPRLNKIGMAPYNSQNVAAQFVKNTDRSVGWPWKLMLFSLLLFALAVVLYGGAIFGYIPYLKSQISELDNNISQLKRDIDSETRSRFLDLYSQISGIQKLLKEHVKTSRLFALLEANTNTKVKYDRVRINTDQLKIDIDGSAATYEHLAQQLEAFRRNPNISRINLKESHVGEGGMIAFSLTLSLTPSAIH
jgi:hypothetical protein